jgi:poly-gamma-glutamate synthesis protein (capsule biosynthesis protein)
MTGRGIDQILPHPLDPRLYEPSITSSLGYVDLAEAASGPIPRPVPFDYVWGEALATWDRVRCDLSIVNLETSVTRSNRPVMKGINYRMSPANVGVLAAAGFDCCVLANNHILDWGRSGLLETLDVLQAAGFRTAGAGRDLEEARAPAILPLEGGGRVLVYAVATETSGAPDDWAATPRVPGLNLTDLSVGSAEGLAEQIQAETQPGDIVVLSIHWGANWGYRIPEAHTRFAHFLTEQAGVSIVHGHSSHHPLGVEVHDGRLVLYGCGDFLNDYEGIGGEHRDASTRVLGFVAELGADGTLLGLEASPLRIRRFRLNRASDKDVAELLGLLNREGARFGVRAELEGDAIVFSWPGGPGSPERRPSPDGSSAAGHRAEPL